MSDLTSNEITHFHKIKDADLVFLVDIVNKTQASLGLTVLTKGTMISGQLTSGKEYYDYVASEISKAGEAGIALSKYFSDKADTIYSPKEDEDAPNSFMHLKDITVRSHDGKLNAINGGYLRLKIEEIDGHTVGRMV